MGFNFRWGGQEDGRDKVMPDEDELDVTVRCGIWVKKVWRATTASRKAGAGSVPELPETQQMGLCVSASQKN